MAHPDPGAAPGRPHHISSIAHLFLQEQPQEREVDKPAAPLVWAVAGPGDSPVSAFAAAGLVHACSPRGTLVEGDAPRWTAGSFSVPSGEQSPVHGPAESRVAETETFIHHLGCLDPVRMGQMESLVAGRGFGFVPLTGVGKLYWALLSGEAGSFRAAHLLGRLIEQLRPERLELLVFPQAWARAGLPGWLVEISTGDPGGKESDHIRLCADLAAQVAGGIPVGVHLVKGSDNLPGSFSGQRGDTTFWSRTVRHTAGGAG